MKKFEKLEIMLSVVCVLNLVLSFCVSQASTNVVWLQPQGNTSGEFTSDMGYVAESFTATADTIRTASFFCGKERPNGYYYGYINTSPNPGGITVFGSSAGLKYQDVVFTFNAQVTRGQRYYFVVQHQEGGSSQGLEYYFREGTAYLQGSLYVSGTQDTAHDLCTRIAGVNRTDSTFWGTNGELYWNNPQNVDTLVTKAKAMGMGINREQVRWDTIQQRQDTYNWTRLDELAQRTQANGLRVLLNFYATPTWASTDPDTADTLTTGPASQYPPRNLDRPFTGQDSNYLWEFLDTLAKRYSAMGVHDYEVYNEVGYYKAWRFGLGRDTCYYKNYDRNPSGRAKLYVKACQAACNAIKGADPQAKIYANAVADINVPMDDEQITGKEWLQYFYSNYGKNYSDVITYHWYSRPESPNDPIFSRHKFLPSQFIRDYDTLRMVMRNAGDGAKPVWADEGGFGTPDTVQDTSIMSVSRAKQADIVVQATVTGLGQRENGNGPGIDQVNWYRSYDRIDYLPDSLLWYNWAGVLDSATTGQAHQYKPSAYAYKQMTTKLKNLYFNRRVIRPDPAVWCYEFQIPGPDTALRTWCMWRDTLAKEETLSVRTNVAYLVTRDTIGAADSVLALFLSDGSGRVRLTSTQMDNTSRYLHEYGAVSRPDVIVDSLWLVPSNPRAGEGLRFYARIKNISTTDSLKASITNLVKFQVDGVTKATYQAQRGLGVANSGTDTLTVGYYGNSTNGGEGWDRDWTAKWGDHLIRAWADSADRYVELREDNNQGYLFKHIAPKVSVLINNNHEFTNHFLSDTLNITFNGGTSTPDSMRVKNEGNWGSWITPVVTTYNVDFDPENGDYPRWDSVEVRQGSDAAIGGDSILVDTHPPIATITSPAHGATVSGTITLWGHARDYSADHFRVDTLWYFRDANHHDTIHVSWVPIGAPKQPGVLGTWNTTLVNDGLTQETLAVWDSAGNASRDSITLNVLNYSQTDGGDSWATGFGTYTSPVMNVATDPAGNVYFAETQNSKIRKYSAKKDSLFAFSARRSDSTGLNWAVGMVLKDSTTLYVADGYGHCVKAFDRQGNLLLRFGSFGTGQGQFKQPCGIALDHKGRLFVVDRLNHRVQVFSDSSGGFLFQFGGQGQDSGKFNSPTGIAITLKDTLLGIAQDLIWVSDSKNDQIQVFDSLGNYLKTIKQPDTLGFDTPTGICSDKWGDVYVADTKHNRIVELNPYGQRILDFGGLGDSLWQFRNPVGVAASPGAHYLYVADMGNRRVQRFTVILEDSSGGGPQGGAGVEVLPMVYELGPAIPNPMNGATTIRYSLPKESQVNLTIYNVAGQVVREYNPGKQEAGFYSYKWDGRSNLNHKVGAGVYFYRLEAGSWVKTRKMIVIR